MADKVQDCRTSQASSTILPQPAPLRDPLSESQACRYRSLQELNTGSFGFVQVAEDLLTKEKVAIKYLSRGSRLKGVDREVLNLRSCLPCPEVITFKQAGLASYLMSCSSF